MRFREPYIEQKNKETLNKNIFLGVAIKVVEVTLLEIKMGIL